MPVYPPSTIYIQMSDMPICILDFDGVLHHDDVYYKRGVGIHMRAEGHTLFEWAPILIKLLDPRPDVRIVLSTSWVRARSFEFAKSVLPDALRARVVGSTFHNREFEKSAHDFMASGKAMTAFDYMTRGKQVENYVGRRGLRRWFAIDNDVDGWPKWCEDRLVKTEDDTGISDPEVQDRLRSILVAL